MFSFNLWPWNSQNLFSKEANIWELAHESTTNLRDQHMYQELQITSWTRTTPPTTNACKDSSIYGPTPNSKGWIWKLTLLVDVRHYNNLMCLNFHWNYWCLSWSSYRNLINTTWMSLCKNLTNMASMLSCKNLTNTIQQHCCVSNMSFLVTLDTEPKTQNHNIIVVVNGHLGVTSSPNLIFWTLTLISIYICMFISIPLTTKW